MPGGLQGLEELNELIVWTIPGRCAVNRAGFRQHRFFQSEVGVEIDLRRLDRFVTEPDGDEGTVDAGLQQLHCRAVSKNVGSHPLLRQSWTGLLGITDVPVDQPLDGVGAEAAATRAWKEERRLYGDRVFHP